MKFTASHISFTKAEDAWVFAFSDRAESADGTNVLLSYSDEDDQDRALGLTGLFVETSWAQLRGYGLVERLAYDGSVLSIMGRNGLEDIQASIETDMMTRGAIEAATNSCNRANATRPEKMA